MLHIDIPGKAEIQALAAARDGLAVTIYLPTSPVPADTEKSRIDLKNLVAEAATQWTASGGEARAFEPISTAIAELVDDRVFWSHQSNTLAIFATTGSLATFRLPNRLSRHVQVADRFKVKPLMRATTFPQASYVLALAQNSVRLIEVAADAEPQEVQLPDMPADAAESVGLDAVTRRDPSGRLHGSEGQKVRLRQYARAVNQAMRPFLAGQALPLILAATEPLAGIFRSVNTYPHLAAEGIAGNPEETSNGDLAAAARLVLNGLYAGELAALTEEFERLRTAGRAVSDLSDVARAATFGAVGTLFVDIDHSVPGTVDADSGVITVDGTADANNYGVVDEVLRRSFLADARILAVRAEDVPGGGPVAAMLRFAV
ncbi:hypothetical protein [Specibacter cremeus]|uniref:baeRF11 domain-containing protein n=1 Tax=Specibacter cremeus TaxID=1629051 RepID=UPI000F7966E8|nr:hypothetical protein [Specibacter cremeus]